MSVVPFQVSLINPSNNQPGITIDAQCCNFTITDFSNYITSTEPGNEIANFASYRFVVITHQSGNFVTLASIAAIPPNPPYTQMISPASSGNNTFTTPIFNGDGIYTFQLFTVPNWINSVAYVNGVHCVYYTDGNLYLCVISNTGETPSTTSTYWTVITQAQLTSKYQTSLFDAVICQIRKCWNLKTQQAVCGFGAPAWINVNPNWNWQNDGQAPPPWFPDNQNPSPQSSGGLCNSTLCTNPYFLAAAQLDVLYNNLCWNVKTQNYNASVLDINLMKTICSC